jgi:hypothetical protein
MGSFDEVCDKFTASQQLGHARFLKPLWGRIGDTGGGENANQKKAARLFGPPFLKIGVISENWGHISENWGHISQFNNSRTCFIRAFSVRSCSKRRSDRLAFAATTP